MATALELIRDVALNLKELRLATSSADGTATTIVASGLKKYFPRNLSDFNAWVYGMSGTNLGSEQRAASWAVDSYTLSLYTPGFSAETRSGDTFEIHLRTERSVKLNAINEAIGLLGLYWNRKNIDTSVITAENTWEYALTFAPSGCSLDVYKIEIQSDTDVSLVGYPYLDAGVYDWRVDESISATGTLSYVLRFGIKPPSNRRLRIHATMGLSSLSADADVLPLSGRWGRAAETWVVNSAVQTVLEIEARGNPATNSVRLDADAAKIDKSLERLLREAPAPPPSRIIVPGRGTAQGLGVPTDLIYLGVV